MKKWVETPVQWQCATPRHPRPSTHLPPTTLHQILVKATIEDTHWLYLRQMGTGTFMVQKDFIVWCNENDRMAGLIIDVGTILIRREVHSNRRNLKVKVPRQQERCFT